MQNSDSLFFPIETDLPKLSMGHEQQEVMSLLFFVITSMEEAEVYIPLLSLIHLGQFRKTRRGCLNLNLPVLINDPTADEAMISSAGYE